MPTRDNIHPITEKQLSKHLGAAEDRMRTVPMRGPAYDLVEEFRKLSGAGGYLLDEKVNHVLQSIRRGLCLYYALYETLLTKIDQHQAAFMGSFALFGMGAFIAQLIPAPESEQRVTFTEYDAKSFTTNIQQGPDAHLKTVLSLYLKVITQTERDGSAIVQSVDDLVYLTREYFIAARDQMAADADAHAAELLAQIESFPLRIEKEGLELRGFSFVAASQQQKVEFTPVLPEQIVGNTAAKRALLRYVDRLALYDAARGFNPILELGGLPSTVLFDGFPGTGKSSLFRLAMTRMHMRSEQVGLPARFVAIDPSIKDEYYGKTAKLLREKLDLASDRSALTLLFFDDIDLLLLARGDAGMGGSDKDVLNLTMQFLDGAFTVNVGNAQTYAATNEPTATDSALRQRFHHREAIDGPEDWDDYAALLGIKLGRQLEHGLVQVGGALPTPQQAQGTAANKSLELTKAIIPNPPKPPVPHMSWRELGALCAELKRKDPRFTGRPIESVTQKLLAESADFEVPEEWFSNPELFLQKPYDQKVALLKTLYRPITGEMIAAELERYFSSEQRYGDAARAQRAERMAADMEAQIDARKLVEQGRGASGA